MNRSTEFAAMAEVSRKSIVTLFVKILDRGFPQIVLFDYFCIRSLHNEEGSLGISAWALDVNLAECAKYDKMV